jgi:tetratricopeptide (TPR) repeat protein
MSKAPPRHVLVTDQVAGAADGKFLWDQLDPMEIKGKSQTVTAFQLSGVRTGQVRRHSRYPLPMVGRERELRFIENRMDSALSGVRRVVGITAEAGLGKSRLVAETVRNLRAAGHRVVFGEAEVLGRQTSHLVWREPWRTLFGLEDIPEADQAVAVTQALAELGQGRATRAPLLGNLLEVDIAENAVTSSFDPKLRKASLESLLSEVLEAELATRPLVIVLEDCHWMDAASLDLLEVLVRNTGSMPLLVIVAYRSEIDPKVRERLMSLPTYEELLLEELTSSDVDRVIAAKFEQQFGAGISVAPEIVGTIAERGNGNPFYIEELINFLRRHEVDLDDPATLDRLDIPESLQALVLRRVDSLEPRPRHTLKVASVIGREFSEPMLPGVHPDLGSEPEVSGYVQQLGDADLVVRSRQADDAWLFRHAVTREVAYEGIPYQLRTQLHEAAASYLERRRDSVGFNLDLLAYHYWNSDNLEKKVDYLRRAGEAAQASYANGAAIDYYERLAGVVEQAERSAVLLKLGEVLELVGDWDRAETVEREALDLAETAGDLDAVGWCEVGLAEVARKQGRYDEAAGLLDSADAHFGEVGNLAGRGRVLHLAGTIAAQRGDLAEAGDRYNESLAIREELGDSAGVASLLSNLGVVAEYSGDLDEAKHNHERALETRIEVGDQWAIAVSNTNLGTIAVLTQEFEEARDRFEEAMRLNREVGDSWMVAVSHNNLGNALRGLGDTDGAKAHYAVSADEYRSYGDRWATAFLLEDVAILAMSNGAPIAGIELLGAADRMREEIDAPRSESLREELERRAIDCCGVETERSQARDRGRGWDFATALSQVVEFCTK